MVAVRMSLCESDWKMAQARRYLLQRRHATPELSLISQNRKVIVIRSTERGIAADNIHWLYYSLPSKGQAGFSCHFVHSPIISAAKSCPVRRALHLLRSRPDGSGVPRSPKYHDLLSHSRSHHPADLPSPFLIFCAHFFPTICLVALRTSLHQAILEPALEPRNPASF